LDSWDRQGRCTREARTDLPAIEWHIRPMPLTSTAPMRVIRNEWQEMDTGLLPLVLDHRSQITFVKTRALSQVPGWTARGCADCL